MENKIIKLEIIISKSYIERLANLLDESGVTGFTGLEIARGKGKLLGEHIADGISDDTLWMLVFTVITYPHYQTFSDNLATFLSTVHGTCIITEVLETTNLKM